MPSNWKRLVEADPATIESDYQRAASRLITEQVLYASNPRQRTDYDLVSANLREFKEALWLFGYELQHDTDYRYVVAIPRVSDGTKVTTAQTLMALTLRQLYELAIQTGTLDRGVAGVNMPELEQAHHEITGRELPMKQVGPVIELLNDMRRWGIARPIRVEEAGEATWYVEILPAVTRLLDQRAAAVLKAYGESQYEPEATPLIDRDHQNSGASTDPENSSEYES